MDKAITDLINTLNKIAPYMWEVCVRQQRIDAYTFLAALTIFSIAFFFFARWAWDRPKHRDDKDCVRFFIILALAILVMIAVVGSRTSIMQIVNPEYYAVKTLLGKKE